MGEEAARPSPSILDIRRSSTWRGDRCSRRRRHLPKLQLLFAIASQANSKVDKKANGETDRGPPEQHLVLEQGAERCTTHGRNDDRDGREQVGDRSQPQRPI